MRFLELHFPAFGPFTDFRLDLQPGPGLHLIYGPNESGKSSALRAVRGLLYGISSDGRDEFLHPGETLRLKALLQHSKGARLAFGRRKGRGKKTLLDGEGKPCQEDALEAYLQGVDGALFDRLYGLDHRTLSLGGKALLEEGGKVGESLFAAGLGPGFRQVRDSLREEAEQLWKPKSRILAIDKAIESYRAAQKKAAELSVSAESWRKISDQMGEEEERAAALEREIRRLDVDRQRLARYLDAHKPLTARQHLVEELASLGQLPDLALDFSERRQQAQSALTALRLQLARIKESQANLTRRRDELPAESGLLAYAQRIDRLHRSLDAVAEAEAALPVTRARAEAMARRLRSVGTDLGLPAEPQSWGRLPDAAQRARARRLAERYRRLVDDESALIERIAALRRQQAVLQERRESLGLSRDTGELEAGLKRLRMALGIDTEIAGLESTLKQKQAALSTALAGLPLWSGTVEELAALSPPDALRLADFERQEASLEEQLKRVEDDRKGLEREGKSHKEQLAQLRDRDKVRSRADLRQARQRRDQAWQELLERDVQDRQAQARVVQGIRETDELSDRMLDDAARVADLERLTAELQASRQEWVELTQLRKDRLAERERVQQGWRELWNSPRLSLRPPAEMRAWLPRRDAVISLAVEVRGLEERLGATVGKRALGLEAHRRLWRELVGEAGLGASVGEAIDRAERALTPLLQAADERRRIEGEAAQGKLALGEAEAALESARAHLCTWRSEWAEVAVAFHRDSDAEPADLESVLERYEELRGLTDDLDRAERELAEQSAQSSSFRRQMKDLAAELGENAETEDLAELIERLVESLAEQRRLHTVRQQLAEQLETVVRERSETERTLGYRESEWAELLREAGAGAEEGLARLEARVARRRQVVERLRDIEDTLRPLAAGQPMDEFAQRLADMDWDTVPGQIRDLDRRMEGMEQDRAQAWHRKGQLEQELTAFNGAEAAAEAAQEAAEAMAEGKATVARYARLAMAEAVLMREMDRYRRENEAPVLRAASVWFERLTRGAYPGLATGLDPRTDAPRLEAVSSSGRHVPVEGLSDGTRDQLFLALRLATIEQSLDSSEPIPMVMDDVLVHFDSDRARATLEVLAEFGQRTQVLLFTHLERDKQLAEALPPEQAAVLTLEPIGL
jgi:uncharacterized protein YhaN